MLKRACPEEMLNQVQHDKKRDFQLKNIDRALCSVFCILLFSSCASTESVSQEQMPEGQIKRTEEKPDFLKPVLDFDRGKESPVETKIPELKIPELVPVKEDISPLQTRVISIAARNTPLRDILYTIAETANLNIVMERGIDPELPITMTLKNLTVEDAMNIIFDSVDYFYSVKDNILIVKSMGTEIFEIGQLSIIQEYKTNVGGDILAGASSGESAITGEVSMTSLSDKLSFQFWDTIENSLKTLLSIRDGGEGAQQASFVVNRMTGTIMVTATKRDLRKVRDFIVNLRRVLNRQVLIEARIVEVQLSEGLKYGIDWSFIEDWRGVGNINIGAAEFSSVVDTTGPNFQISVTGQNFSSVLAALQSQGDVKTLSNPRVNILNGQTAMLSVGRNTSFISSVETTTTTTEGAVPTVTFTVETSSILSGIIFGLAPYINNEGEITLTITPIVSNLVDLEAKTIGTGGNTVEIKLPTVDLREMSTTVRILDGQMVIIGGLIDRKERLQEDKVPILGNIPILGAVFKRVDKSHEKTELVIMLIPKILNR
jgi:MSHA type pilus biogenesis protein MshL